MTTARSLGDPGAAWVDEREAMLPLLGGAYGHFRRNEGLATLFAPSPADDGRLIHPFLAAAGVVFAHWHRRESLHGGAFLSEDGAWGVLGPRTAGKSSLLATLAVSGIPVLTDDLLVTTGRTAFAGPRCVDIRPSAARELDLAGRAERVRGGRRYRVALGQIPPEVPLCGWVFLSWGDRLEARALSRPRERIRRLARQLGLRLRPSDPAILIQLASLPAWQVRRPRGWSSVAGTADLVLELTGA